MYHISSKSECFFPADKPCHIFPRASCFKLICLRRLSSRWNQSQHGYMDRNVTEGTLWHRRTAKIQITAHPHCAACAVRFQYLWIRLTAKFLGLRYSHIAYRSFSRFEKHCISTAPWEKVSLGICGQRRPRSDCASAQSDQGLRCPLIECIDA